MPLTRQFWVIVHRWAGLTIAVFLIVAGFTGALLAFNEELTDLTAPWHVVEPPSPGAATLDPLELNELAQRAAPPGYRVEGLRLGVDPEHVLSIGLSPPEGSDQPYLDAALNPYTGEVVRIGEWGSISEGWDQIMPFLYRLHYKLAIDDYGLWAFGIAALFWTLDCFVGFYLTLPVARRRWWAHWGKGWRVKLPSPSNYRLNFDLHRAGGLWLWPLLLVFAWSSVGMNLRAEVYDPVMRAMGADNVYDTIPVQPDEPGFKPNLSRAYGQAQGLLASEGRRLDFTVASRNFLYFDTDKHVYTLSFATTGDFASKGNWSMLAFTPDGRLVKLALAQGALHQGAADNWLMALHTAAVGGLPYRILTTLVGLVITMLSVTGVAIWMKKRSARIARKGRTASAEAPVLDDEKAALAPAANSLAMHR